MNSRFLAVMERILWLYGPPYDPRYHPAWSPLAATLVRRGITLLAALATAAVLSVTPTANGIVGAGRLLVLWPAVAVTGIAYALWAWQARRP